MPNDFYTPTGNPTDNSNVVSTDMRAEFAGIETGFNKLPALTGNANKLVAVNSSASGLDICSTIAIGGAGKTLSLTGEGASFLEISSFSTTPILRAGGGATYMQLDDSRFIGYIQISAAASWVWEPGAKFSCHGIDDDATAKVINLLGAGANYFTLTNSITNPTIGTSAGDLAISSRVQANAGLTVSNATLVSRGLTDSATATALTLSGSGANSVTITNSATTPAIGTTAGALAITSAITAASTITAAGSVQANNDDATPAGGGPGLGLFIGSAAIGIYIGSGVPSVSATDGSIYIRTDGGAGSCIYQRRSSAWVATAA